MPMRPQISLSWNGIAPKRRKILHHNALLFIDGIYEKAALLLRPSHIEWPAPESPSGIEPAEINKRHHPVFIKDIIPSVNLRICPQRTLYSKIYMPGRYGKRYCPTRKRTHSMEARFRGGTDMEKALSNGTVDEDFLHVLHVYHIQTRPCRNIR